MTFQTVNIDTPVWLIPALPLFGAVVLLLLGRKIREPLPGWVGTLLVGGSFLLTALMALDFVNFDVPMFEVRGDPGLILRSQVFEWIAAGSFTVDVAFRVDQLALVMALTVTGVGALIHLYSIEYMAGDPRYSRFFGYMNLFVFFMLVLVLADNFLLLYVGWEGVGLCSYLLIGFWFERKTAADAAKKAFIVTRIGDSAFLIGIIFIWLIFKSLDFTEVFARVIGGAPAGFSEGTATIIALLLFAGAVGKSAQLPLHTWLPDAMEGPTPVSALIHAATMVTAGVYLVVRTHPIFEASGIALTVVAVVGIATAIYAGLSAIGQDDIKRMLAYSTISQLGFMFFGAGVGAYSAAIFLLVTHAFFKALLFLGAGSVMHAMDDRTDMLSMGGLRRLMPVTAGAWLLGAAAMAGIPPFSGFFSKDQVLAAASEAGRTGLWVVALFGALLTAIYTWRATFIVFFGRQRFDGHPHEAPRWMRLSLMALAAGAVGGGVLGLSATAGILPRFLEPVLGARHVEEGVGPSELVLTLISVAVAAAGIGLAWFVYRSGRIDWMALRGRFGGAKRAMERGFFVDDVYGGALVGPAKLGAAFAAYVLDKRVIDGAVVGVGKAFASAASVGRKVQTGLVRNYALAFLLGVVGLLWYLAARS
jgi:NADH-quinone oxidoreductase subunit L